MKTHKLLLFAILCIMASCKSLHQIPPEEKESGVPPTKQQTHLSSADFNLKSIKSKIRAIEAIGPNDTAVLICYYRILDTIQQNYIQELEDSRLDIMKQREWVDWFVDDTSVFARQWSSYEIPSSLAKHVQLYTILGSIRQYLDTIEKEITRARTENPKLSEEHMKYVILPRIKDSMDGAETLLTKVGEMHPKELLSESQYGFYRTQADRYNANLKYYE